MESYKNSQADVNGNIFKALSLCNETINFYKNFTTNHDTFVSSKEGQILTKVITNAIDDIFARIENIIPSNVTVVPNNISNKEIFNYNLYLDTISRFPKTAILFDCEMDSNGFISDISIKKKFETYTHNFLNYIFRKYNSDDLSSLVSLKTADVLNLPYRQLLDKKKNKEKEPEPIVVPPRPLEIPLATTSSPKVINLPSISDSEDLAKLTKENTEFNEADSSKYFPSRALYREYKVLDSNVAEWAKTTAVKLSASNKRVSFQVPYKLTFSDSSSDRAKDPSTFQKIFDIKKPVFSGNIEDADDFVYQFHDYLHHFAHPPNEEYLCTAFLSCLPSYQRNYFYNKFLPARGVNSGRITIPFNEILAHFQSKFATYSIDEAQKLWNNLKIDKNYLDVFETKLNKIAKILKISDYAKGLKVFEIIPKKWQEEAIKKNICFSTFSDDNFKPIMRFVNKMALEERVLQDQRSEYLQLSGVRSQNQEIQKNFNNASRKGSTRSHNKKTTKIIEPATPVEQTKNNTRAGYKAFKRRNKNRKRRQASYFNTIDISNSDDIEEDFDNEIDIMKEQLQELLTPKGEEFQKQEIQCTNEVSHYFINEMFIPSTKDFKDGENIQKLIDKIQIAAPWKITKYAEAYINPIIKNDKSKPPMIRILMLIDSGGSLNLISKKLMDALKLPSKTSYQEFSTIAGKAKATRKALISFCCKLKDRIRQTEDSEFINAVPQYSHFLVVKNLPFVVIDSPEYMFSIGKMAQRTYHIPIDRIEEFFPTDQRAVQDEPGNIRVINNTIEEKMQSQLVAEESDKQYLTRNNINLEDLPPEVENQLNTINPRRIIGDNHPTSWDEVRVHSSASQENEKFRRHMNEVNSSIIYTSNFYDVSFHNIINKVASENESELLNLQRDLHRNEVTFTNEKTINKNAELINKLLPLELIEFKDVFKVPRGIPPTRGKWDFKLNITKQDIATLPLAKPKVTSKEASTKEMIKNYLDEGWIEPAVLPHAVNMFPVPKHDGSFRYVYNYVPVNKICDIAQNSIPNFREQVNELCKHKYVICLDLRSAYNQIRITDALTKEATAFICEWGIYTWNVMPFGLSDAPPFFQAFMNFILFDKLFNGVLCYLDDVVVYGDTKTECLENCKWVLARFRKFKVYCKIEKCQFFPSKIEYLGFLIKEGAYIPLNLNKLSGISCPESLNKLQKVLGLLNWFSDFIPKYADIIKSLSDNLSNFNKNSVRKHFYDCIQKLETYPRAAFNFDEQFILVSDASEFAGAGVLYQIPKGGEDFVINKLTNNNNNNKNITTELYKNNQIKLIGFYSFKFDKSQLHYSMFDKELLSIIRTLEHFSYFTSNTKYPIICLTDNNASKEIINGNSQKVVDNRRKRYIEPLLEYKVKGIHIKGKTNDIADWLSRLQFEK